MCISEATFIAVKLNGVLYQENAIKYIVGILAVTPVDSSNYRFTGEARPASLCQTTFSTVTTVNALQLMTDLWQNLFCY